MSSKWKREESMMDVTGLVCVYMCACEYVEGGYM